MVGHKLKKGLDPDNGKCIGRQASLCVGWMVVRCSVLHHDHDCHCMLHCVNGPCLLDYLILKLRLPVVLYVSLAVDSR